MDEAYVVEIDGTHEIRIGDQPPTQEELDAVFSEMDALF